MGINFNFGLGGKGDGDDSKAGTAGAADPTTAVVADPNAGTTPPPTEPIMVTPPAVATEFGDDITINVTDAPLNIEPVVAAGEPQITEVVVEPTVAATPVVVPDATPLNPFADNTAPDAVAATPVAPVVAENPFAAPIEAVIPTPVVAEPVVLEANQATPILNSVEEAPLNPFAAEAEVVLPTPVATENPFATDATAPQSVAEAPVEVIAEVPAAANPFAAAEPAPAEVAEEVVNEIKLEEAAPVVAPVVAENPFATDEVKAEETVVTPEVKETTVEASENPFGDMSFGEEKADTEVKEVEEAPAVAFNFEKEETPAVMPEADIKEIVEVENVEAVVEKSKPEPKAKTPKGDGSSPLSSLQNIKAEIAGFVATHNQNVEDYKSEIKALEAKINGEKNLLKKRKQEFRNMLGEIEALTEDFNPGNNSNQSEKADNQNSKPKRNRNRNKKTNQDSETNQNQNKDA